MNSFRRGRDLIAALVVSAVIWPTSLFAQSQPSASIDQSNRISITYVPPESSELQELYEFLRAHRALGSVPNKDSNATRVVIQGFRIGGGLDAKAALLAER